MVFYATSSVCRPTQPFDHRSIERSETTHQIIVCTTNPPSNFVTITIVRQLIQHKTVNMEAAYMGSGTEVDKVSFYLIEMVVVSGDCS